MQKIAIIILALMLAGIAVYPEVTRRVYPEDTQRTTPKDTLSSVMKPDPSDSIAGKDSTLVLNDSIATEEHADITLVESPEQTFVTDTVKPLCDKVRNILQQPFNKEVNDSLRKQTWAIITNHNNGTRKLSDIKLFHTIDTLDIYLSRYEKGAALFEEFRKKAEPLLGDSVTPNNKTTKQQNNKTTKAANRYTAITRLLYPSDKKTLDERKYNEERYFRNIPYLHNADSLLKDSLKSMQARCKSDHDECIKKGEAVIKEIANAYKNVRKYVTRREDYDAEMSAILKRNDLKKRLDEDVLPVDELRETWQKYEKSIKP